MAGWTFLIGPYFDRQKSETDYAARERTRIETDTQRDIARVEAALNALILREMDRNNRLEREMGAVQKINELFQTGKLKLD